MTWEVANRHPGVTCPPGSSLLAALREAARRRGLGAAPRRDLRVRDNPALAAAAAGGANAVVPVFVWAPEEEGQFQSGRCSRWWYVAPLKRGSKEHGVLKGRGRPRGVCIARARLFPVRMTSPQPNRA